MKKVIATAAAACIGTSAAANVTSPPEPAGLWRVAEVIVTVTGALKK